MSDKTEDFLDRAYGLKSLEDAMAFYEEWAGDYDEQMEDKLNYVAPRQCAEHLGRHLSDKDAVILDAGCGTGLTSFYLHKQGFTVLDGIDFADAMLEKSRERGIYRTLTKADLTQPLDIADGTYGAAVSSGVFTLGHVGSEPVPEILRVLAPGAPFACTIHREIWQPMGFEERFRQAEADGLIEQVEIERGHFFTHLEPVAMYCLFRKT